MKKILYFVHGGMPTEKQKAEIAKLGAFIRNASAFGANDFVEKCDAVAGDAPDAYKARYPVVGDKLDPIPASPDVPPPATTAEPTQPEQPEQAESPPATTAASTTAHRGPGRPKNAT